MIRVSVAASPASSLSRRPRARQGLARPGSDTAMGVAEIVTVCTGALLPELREFIPAARVAFPDVAIHVYTDDEGAVIATCAECLVDGVRVHGTRGAEPIDLSRVARHADYWQADAIWWKLLALHERVSALPRGSRDGVLLADCDLTFRLGLERTMRGEVALSPFYWGRRSIRVDGGGLLQHRDGEFNAGMLLTRSVAFCEWWMGAYLSGLGGFYEQGCLDLAPEAFRCDYFSPLHNWGKWRFAAPHSAVRSYHQHLGERSLRHDVGELKVAAQAAAAEARAMLRDHPGRRA